MSVRVEKNGVVTTVVLDRPHVRNAVDCSTAALLADAFRAFEADPEARVAVLWGAGGTFCAGADLKAVAEGRPNRLAIDGEGPMGPSRMQLSKPVIAAIAGHASRSRKRCASSSRMASHPWSGKGSPAPSGSSRALADMAASDPMRACESLRARGKIILRVP